MNKKGPFEWTSEADVAFQGLKKYLTSPPVMVAPRPLEPLVLYLADTPHSASATLVAIREERQVKGRTHDAARSDETTPHHDGAPEAAAALADDQDPQDGAPEVAATPTGDLAPGVPQPQEAPQPQEISDSTNASALVEHPVYFVGTVLRGARACYPMPQKLLLVLLVAS
nr:uncharacterized protein LOC109757545 [Aegilops tauschii subsp. strangulata]